MQRSCAGSANHHNAAYLLGLVRNFCDTIARKEQCFKTVVKYNVHMKYWALSPTPNTPVPNGMGALLK